MPTAQRILVSEYESRAAANPSCSAASASVGPRPAVAISTQTSRKDDEKDYNHHQFDVTGPWSATERALFDQAIEVFGWGNWQLFKIPGRSNDQVKTHAYKRARKDPNLKLKKMNAQKEKEIPQALDLPQEYYDNFKSQAAIDLPKKYNDNYKSQADVGQSSVLSSFQRVPVTLNNWKVPVTLNNLMNATNSERYTEASYSINQVGATHVAIDDDDMMNSQSKDDSYQVAKPNEMKINPLLQGARKETLDLGTKAAMDRAEELLRTITAEQQQRLQKMASIITQQQLELNSFSTVKAQPTPVETKTTTQSKVLVPSGAITTTSKEQVPIDHKKCLLPKVQANLAHVPKQPRTKDSITDRNSDDPDNQYKSDINSNTEYGEEDDTSANSACSTASVGAHPTAIAILTPINNPISEEDYYNEGKWCHDEKAKFERGVLAHGWADWKSIGTNFVTTRKISQIKSHAQKLKKNHPEKVEQLKKEHKEFKEKRMKEREKNDNVVVEGETVTVRKDDDNDVLTPPISTNSDYGEEDSDDEIGAMIYRSSSTAKKRSAAAALVIENTLPSVSYPSASEPSSMINDDDCKRSHDGNSNESVALAGASTSVANVSVDSIEYDTMAAADSSYCTESAAASVTVTNRGNDCAGSSMPTIKSRHSQEDTAADMKQAANDNKAVYMQPLYQCPLCDRTNLTQGGLRHHYLSAHPLYGKLVDISRCKIVGWGQCAKNSSGAIAVAPALPHNVQPSEEEEAQLAARLLDKVKQNAARTATSLDMLKAACLVEVKVRRTITAAAVTELSANYQQAVSVNRKRKLPDNELGVSNIAKERADAAQFFSAMEDEAESLAVSTSPLKKQSSAPPTSSSHHYRPS